MPAKRLPWIKLWIEAAEHEKIALLTDPEYRTWTLCLQRGSQQPTRWRFGSARHAALVTGRPVKHIKTLIDPAKLLDLHPDGSVWVHDAPYWQDRSPSDFGGRADDEDSANAPGSLREGSADRSAKTPGTLRQSSAKPPRNAPRSLREGSGEASAKPPSPPRPPSRESDTERELPPAKAGGAPDGAAPSGPTWQAQLFEAFDAIGLDRPSLVGEGENAKRLIKLGDADLVAQCWQEILTGQYGDGWLQQNLSFKSLAERRRFENWMLAKAGKVTAPSRNGTHHGRNGAAPAGVRPTSASASSDLAKYDRD